MNISLQPLTRVREGFKIEMSIFSILRISFSKILTSQFLYLNLIVGASVSKYMQKIEEVRKSKFL